GDRCAPGDDADEHDLATGRDRGDRLAGRCRRAAAVDDQLRGAAQRVGERGELGHDRRHAHGGRDLSASERRLGQRDPLDAGITATWPPTRSLDTALPTATTVPAISWPITAPAGSIVVPSRCTSLPQIPARATATMTSSGPGVGSARSTSSSVPLAVIASAR